MNSGRMNRFEGYFSPIVHKILINKLALLKLVNTSATTSTHLIKLKLSGLPETTRKPRLRLDEVSTVALAELPEQYRNRMEQGLRHYPGAVLVIGYIWEIRTPDGSSAGPGILGLDYNPLLDENGKTRELLEAEGDCYIKTINDMAEGNRPALFNSIRATIKNNQAQRS